MEIGVIVVFILGYLVGRLKHSLIFSSILSKDDKIKYVKRGINIDKKDFYYWMLIMSVICIMWISSDLYLNDKFTEYISFAGTITSILLGLLAIIYSFVQSIDSNNSVKTLQDISKKLEEFSEEIQQQVGVFGEFSEGFGDQIGEVTDKIDKALTKLDKVQENIESIKLSNDLSRKSWVTKGERILR